MTRARCQQVCLDATPYYHCVSRCVRRTFLCGYDDYSKRDFEHRRGWIESRIKDLSQIYCIDICAYAVMSNHYHLVVHINKKQAINLSESEVVELWGKMHVLPVLVQRWLRQELKSEAEHKVAQNIIQIWRERLYSLSWFMRELNFDIALKANQEEDCKGHFWESRYKSQALLDEKALLAAMAYTDLNPIRSGNADTPENSDYTSIKERLTALNHQQATAPCLHPFIGNSSNAMLSGIPFRLMDYLELVDWTGRQFREGKASISSRQPPLMKRLNINQREWLKACSQLEKQRALCIGTRESIQCNLTKLHRRRMCGYQLS